MWKTSKARLGSFVAMGLLVALAGSVQARERWTIPQANAWYERQPWFVGSNYTPATAINQLEMWQAETFDAATIDKELGWAQAIGMNAMRVFLHNLLWEQDAAGFKRRIDQFLGIAERHNITRKKNLWRGITKCSERTVRLTGPTRRSSSRR